MQIHRRTIIRDDKPPFFNRSNRNNGGGKINLCTFLVTEKSCFLFVFYPVILAEVENYIPIETSLKGKDFLVNNFYIKRPVVKTRKPWINKFSALKS